MKNFQSVQSVFAKGYPRSSASDMDLPPFFDLGYKLLDERIIMITGEIDDRMSSMVKTQLLYLEKQSPNEDIKMYIDSPGGSVYSGLGIVDTMEYISCDIETINTGLAASMAAIILCCGTPGKRKSLKRSRCMIHQPLGYTGFAQASDIEIDARQINSLKRELYEIISQKTGQKIDKVHKDSDRDYWMSAEEAKNYGMIDTILTKR
jgi:ATP-dependent Clp protease protease subunit